MNHNTQSITFAAVHGTAEDKGSATRWTGRQAGKQKRMDITLSAPIVPCTPEEIASMDTAALATLLSDSTAAYVRRVKCQRLTVGDSIALTFTYPQMLKILTTAVERTKRLVTTASIRALCLSSEYKVAVSAVIPAEKASAFKRISEHEFYPLTVALDAAVPTQRAVIRDTLIMRMAEISLHLAEESEARQMMDAMAEMLAALPVVDIEESI